MKKVLALVLAVMMLSTTAFAAVKWTSTITPSGSIKIDQKNGVSAGAEKVTVFGGDDTTDKFVYSWVRDPETGKYTDSGKGEGDVSLQDLGTDVNDLTDILFRSVTTENYTVTNFRVATGRNLVKGVSINDKEERVEVKFVDDLNNTTAKDFDLSFNLKGKGKMIIKDATELAKYVEYTGSKTADIGKRVSIPTVKFKMSGKVGYGKVVVNLGEDSDEEVDGLDSITITNSDIANDKIDKDKDVVKFTYGNSANFLKATRDARAGSYTADAILTEEYGEAMTLEARVYSGDVLFFKCENDPDRDIVGRLADSDADMDFYIFNSDKNFTTFNSNVKMYFNDAEEDDHVYEIKNQKLVPVGKYDEDEGCWVVKTRILGAYVVSDVELKEFEASLSDVTGNPDTGANDVVGIATALAAVALVSAAAVSLKK